MNTGELRALFRSYTDEVDVSFLSDADVALYLKIGYERFRAMVNSTNEFFYAAELDATPNSRTYTLPSFDVLLSISKLSTTNSLAYAELLPVTRTEELYESGSGRQTIRYYLRGNVVQFSKEVTGTLRFTYIPRSTVDFAAAGTVDDLAPYHDLIALLAYSNYAVRDGEINQPLEYLLQQRTMEFKSYLQEGLSREQNSTIADVPDWL